MGRVRSKTRRMSYVSTANRQQRQSYVICHVTFETLKLEPYIVTTHPSHVREIGKSDGYLTKHKFEL